MIYCKFVKIYVQICYLLLTIFEVLLVDNAVFFNTVHVLISTSLQLQNGDFSLTRPPFAVQNMTVTCWKNRVQVLVQYSRVFDINQGWNIDTRISILSKYLN